MKIKKLILLLGIALLTVTVLSGCSYYQNTYGKTDVYGQVPGQIPAKTQTKDMSGDVVKGSYSYKYQFQFVTKDGTVKKMSYEVAGKNPTPLTANRYVKAQISKKRVVTGPNYISESKVPDKALTKLQSLAKN